MQLGELRTRKGLALYKRRPKHLRRPREPDGSLAVDVVIDVVRSIKRRHRPKDKRKSPVEYRFPMIMVPHRVVQAAGFLVGDDISITVPRKGCVVIVLETEHDDPRAPQTD